MKYELFCKPIPTGWYYIVALTLEDAVRHLGTSVSIARSHRKYSLTEALRQARDYNKHSPLIRMTEEQQ